MGRSREVVHSVSVGRREEVGVGVGEEDGDADGNADGDGLRDIEAIFVQGLDVSVWF